MTLYNAVTGLPLDISHEWFVPVGRDFSDPQMLAGRYVGHEGVPEVVTVRMERDALKATVGKHETRAPLLRRHALSGHG